MMRSRNRLDRVADRVMDLDSPAYGDERERAVFMGSCSFGLTTGLHIGFSGAVVASLFGLVLLPVALLVMIVLPAAAASWHATRRGVDLEELAGSGGARSTTSNVLGCGGAMVLTFAALTYTVFMGQSILVAPSIELTPGEGALGGMAQGAVVGGLVGGLAAIVGGVVSLRRAKRRCGTPSG